MHLKLSYLDFDCLSAGVLIGIGFAVALPVFVLVVSLSVFLYRKRWWFRYQYFLAHRLWQNYHKIAAFDTPYTYDLFVSYNKQDKRWVETVLQPKLEEEMELKLCLHDRDFRLGDVISDQIIESIDTSRKTLFILSPSFVESNWCQYEVYMAQHRLFSSGKDVILLALLQPIPDKAINRTLKSLMETKTYAEWTDDVYGQKLFWAKLKQSVQSPIPEPLQVVRNPTRNSSGACTTDRDTRQSETNRDIRGRDNGEREPLLARSGLTESWQQVQAAV